MKCIMVMFDSLNRHMLPPYGCEDIHLPNFQRLQQRAVTFDRSYVCSLQCIPARRDMHTGRPNFLHNRWGPIEPYDQCMPEILSKAGVYTHLASDHQHYWEDRGATYHGRYDSWEFFRGQEGDPFIGQVADPVVPPHINGRHKKADWINREHFKADADYPQSQTFKAGVDFIDRNADQDNWFVQIECFDPHEPFVCDRQWKDRFPSIDESAEGTEQTPIFDWPPYDKVTQTPQEVERARRNYKALLTKCDASLGNVLDAMDRHDLWQDTMLILWTDHGYLLGEHGYWAKRVPPLYEELSHTPFFIYDPRQPDTAGQRRSALVQPSIDIAPTLLDFFDQPRPDEMLGHTLASVIADDTPVREHAIFGMHGYDLNVTDGRYAYYHKPVNDNAGPICMHTLVSVGSAARTAHEHVMVEPFNFTQGYPLMRFRMREAGKPLADPDHLLFDLQADPTQQNPIKDEAVRQQLLNVAIQLMQQADAPPDAYERYGLTQPT